LATKACEETEWKAAHIISTLAAAFAETGNFVKAREMSQKAVDVDGGTGGIDDQLNQELQSYRDEKPWRERQEMTEAELPGLGASNANAAAAETADEQPPAALGKPRRPFD
ncbi:MAG: repeat-containing protein YrrB, partial [Planctomycetota bacterium]